jgi:hypothetical protein
MPLPDATLSDIAWALGSFVARRDEQLLLRRYMAGQQAPTYVTKQFARAFETLLKGLRLNICPAVVHSVTDRLKLTGFSGNDSTDTDAAAAAEQIWRDARLDRHSNKIHNEAVMSGDAFLIVWPGPNEAPAFYPQRAIDCVVRYDAELLDRINLAAKAWLEGRRWRLNLYYPDRIEKYQTDRDTAIARGGGTDDSPPTDPDKFAIFETPGEPWPLPNPFGEVPVFHFAFGAGIGEHGVSELRDVVPLQNSINKLLADMLVASEFGAYKQRWLTGGFAEERTIDVRQPDGSIVKQPVPLELGITRLLQMKAPDARFGEFTATDLSNYINAIDSVVSDVARIKGIPLHEIMMTGTFPSGESQKTAESRLVAKVEHTQIDFGDVWEHALEFALSMSGQAGAGITAQWAEAQSRAELEHIQAIGTKVLQIGVPEEQAWRELDYTDDQIAEFRTTRAQHAAQTANQTAAALAAQLARG